MSSYQIKQFCSLHHIKPRREQGQNFLIDKNILAKIVETAGLKKDDVVLEVGAGLGVLTKELASRAKKVIAIEQDKKLFAVLEKELAGFKNVELINQDVFKVDFTDLKDFKIVSNLPYNITSLFLRHFLSQSASRRTQPNEMVLLVQKEVAKRIIARPPQMSLLAVSVQYYGQPKIISMVKNNSFWPIPAVDSAILKISNIKKINPSAGGEDKEFFKLVKIGFANKRKQLPNNLANGFGLTKPKSVDWLVKAGFNPKIRAQELSIDDWLTLFLSRDTLRC
ncbi:MAG: 16S rRNA (adenine(1518)-N(6)/adenine(1519)-N(6))-dimethyltransferase RsmA [bacterium]